jgi:hypothetical protein
MARTTFSGPVASTAGFEGDVTGDVTGNVTGGVGGSYVQIPTAGTTAIADATDAINTSGKAAGAMVLDTDLNLLYVALGGDADSDWLLIDGVGSTTVTPS